MPSEKSFETTYPKYAFSGLVALALRVARAIAAHRRAAAQPERYPDIFLDKIVGRYPG